MTPEREREISANLERAEQSLQAARDLAARGYHDFGVIASIHQRFVKTGKLPKEQGKELNWLF